MPPKAESLIGVRDEADQRLVFQFKWGLLRVKKVEKKQPRLRKIP